MLKMQPQSTASAYTCRRKAFALFAPVEQRPPPVMCPKAVRLIVPLWLRVKFSVETETDMLHVKHLQ